MTLQSIFHLSMSLFLSIRLFRRHTALHIRCLYPPGLRQEDHLSLKCLQISQRRSAPTGPQWGSHGQKKPYVTRLRHNYHCSNASSQFLPSAAQHRYYFTYYSGIGGCRKRHICESLAFSLHSLRPGISLQLPLPHDLGAYRGTLAGGSRSSPAPRPIRGRKAGVLQLEVYTSMERRRSTHLPTT